MKRPIIFFLLTAALAAVTARAERLTINTPRLSLVISVESGAMPRYVYFGSRVDDSTHLQTPSGGRMDVYPPYGMNCPAETALALSHSDGNMSTSLEATSWERSDEEEASLTVIHLKDPVYNLFVDLFFRAYNDVDMIELWSEITNREKGTVTLTEYASATLPIRRGDVWVSCLHGSWASEAYVTEQPLLPGLLVVKNRDGVRNSHTDHAEVMLSLDGKGRENGGRVIGAALCYSGNYRLRIDTDDTDYHYLFAGINEDNSDYHLKKGETFVTPKLALTFSREGLSGASRNFHRWGRRYMLQHGDKERKILLNSWEGVYFGINEERMDQMMADIAAMGGELFVMDDGWFGGKYPRKNDSSSLGDWSVDSRKLPHGIDSLIGAARKYGISFGIWIEPEMTNTVSELYEKHPEWIIKAPGRDAVTGRGGTQLVLDMGNSKVQDFVFGVVDSLMTRYPGIDYIKWDANMSIMNHGSQYLSSADQSHMYINYHRGLEQVCRRIRAKYPDLTMQACASGGGRANWGLLPWFDELWVSDNTDALQRIYMQWGTSYFFPAIAMACHISAVPNHTVFRVTSLKMRVDVAMSGRLGMEIQPKDMSEEEKAFCRRAISDYKRVRDVVQKGDIYRLVSPFDHKGLASLMYVSEEKDHAVFFWWKTEQWQNEHLPRVAMNGLDPNRMYAVHELTRIDKTPLDCEGKSFSGAYLMEHGIELPYCHNVDHKDKTNWSSRVLELTAI